MCDAGALGQVSKLPGAKLGPHHLTRKVIGDDKGILSFIASPEESFAEMDEQQKASSRAAHANAEATNKQNRAVEEKQRRQFRIQVGQQNKQDKRDLLERQQGR